MVTFTINIPPMLAYIYHTWILWVLSYIIYIAWLFHGMSAVPLSVFPTEVPNPRLLPRSSCSKDDGVSGAQADGSKDIGGDVDIRIKWEYCGHIVGIYIMI
jgi:hypothetical protein